MLARDLKNWTLLSLLKIDCCIVVCIVNGKINPSPDSKLSNSPCTAPLKVEKLISARGRWIWNCCERFIGAMPLAIAGTELATTRLGEDTS